MGAIYMKKYEIIKNLTIIMKNLKGRGVKYFINLLLDKAFVSICYNLVLALILKYVINAIEFKDISLVKISIVIAGVSFCSAFIFQPIVQKTWTYCVRDIMAEIKLKVLKKVEELDVRTLENISSGDLLTRVTKDIDIIDDIYKLHIPIISFALFHGIAAIIFMFYINFVLASAAILLGLLSVLLNYVVSKKIKKYAKLYQEEFSKLSQSIIEIEDGFVDIKINNSEKYFYKKYNYTNSNLKKLNIKREKYVELLSMLNNFFGNFNTIGIIALGMYLAFKGYTDIGSAVAIAELQGHAGYLFKNFSSFLGGLQKTIPSVKRVMDIMNLNEDDEKKCIKENYVNDDNYISIRNLQFSYDGKNNVLNNVNLSIKQGQFIGLVGESGGGKSTLIKILLGFYNNYSGGIFIEGKSAKSIGLKNLRKRISYVSQDCYLFNLSIKENIRLGNLNASDEEIIKASKMANAHEFIMNMENGYETVIDEFGNNISGGQKQRIAIARAFLRNSDVLIMDEGTSALDPETEKAIANTIEKIHNKKIIIMIAHRMDILSRADKIYKIQGGKIS